MNGEDVLRGVADRTSWQDAIAGMTTRQVAETFGISKAAAWRARSGRTREPKFTRSDDFRRFKAARSIRRRADRGRIRTRPLKAAVSYGRRAEGRRSIPAVDLADPYTIARRIERDGWEGGAEALSTQILNAYGDLETYDHLGSDLFINDYETDPFDLEELPEEE
jgi:hypothetical protein